MRKKPTLQNNAGRIARKIAEIIEDRGWTQRQEEREDGTVCLLGGLRYATRPMSDMTRNFTHANFCNLFPAWMAQHFSGPRPNLGPSQVITSVPAWNDHVFTSKEETLAWLRKFADDLDPQTV